MQVVKGASLKLQQPSQRRPLHIGMGRKMSNSDGRGIRFTRGDGKRWEVMFENDLWDDANNNRSVGFMDSESSLARLNSAVHRPTTRSQDQFNLLHGKSSAWNRCKTSDQIIANGLSSFTGSARFNSSRLRSGHMFGSDMCPLQDGCWICTSGGANSKDGASEHKNHSTYPDTTDILLERADTWRDRLSPVANHSLSRAPKTYQPKTWQNFKPEFTQPYRFTYFNDSQS